MKTEEFIGKDIRVAAYCSITSGNEQNASAILIKKQQSILAQRYGWRISKFYFDEGESHEQQDLLLEACRSGKYDLIVCHNLSRLNTDLEAARALLEELAEMDSPVGVLFATEDLVSLEDNAALTLRALSLITNEAPTLDALKFTVRIRKRKPIQ